jgi:hypothetical protein
MDLISIKITTKIHLIIFFIIRLILSRILILISFTIIMIKLSKNISNSMNQNKKIFYKNPAILKATTKAPIYVKLPKN